MVQGFKEGSRLEELRMLVNQRDEEQQSLQLKSLAYLFAEAAVSNYLERLTAGGLKPSSDRIAFLKSLQYLQQLEELEVWTSGEALSVEEEEALARYLAGKRVRESLEHLSVSHYWDSRPRDARASLAKAVAGANKLKTLWLDSMTLPSESGSVLGSRGVLLRRK